MLFVSCFPINGLKKLTVCWILKIMDWLSHKIHEIGSSQIKSISQYDNMRCSELINIITRSFHYPDIFYNIETRLFDKQKFLF